mmetsp:Transcript_23565/g.41847  ORF Transcript_23565/g.41847 Transcript_23565/m.41847 type:complete len:83 (-) Transcript_23565:511-759(-)
MAKMINQFMAKMLDQSPMRFWKDAICNMLSIASERTRCSSSHHRRDSSWMTVDHGHQVIRVGHCHQVAGTGHGHQMIGAQRD